jgi:hypothetical protein
VVATVVAAIIDMVSPSQFGATWRLARLELLEPLGREPSPEEIAADVSEIKLVFSIPPDRPAPNRFRTFGDKREICRVRIAELSFNLSIAMAYRDPSGHSPRLY